jgi:ABC-type oligopeptide transport system substrate-binding subunit
LPEGPDSERIATIFQEAWSVLQTEVNYLAFAENDYNSQLQAANYAIGTISWIGDYVDPMTFLDLFSHNGSLNIAGMNNTAFEAELIKSLTQQGNDRYKTLANAEEILLSSGMCIPLSHSPALNVIDLDQVDGWFENPFDLHPFKSLKPKTPKPPRNIASL